MHLLIIPSWYPQYEKDQAGSFFREQAIALARRIAKVGVLYPNLRSLRELLNPRAALSGTSLFNDEGTFLMQRNGYNLTPRFAAGYRRQWLFHGTRLFEQYVKYHGAPDVIHAHCAFYAGVLAERLGAIHNIPYVITEHSSAYFSRAFSVSQLDMAAEVYARSAHCIAVSRSLSRLLSDDYNFEGAWSVVPNMVSSTFYETVIDFNLPREATRFLNVALLNENKRQELLIDALNICHKLGETTFQLTIIGDGPLRRSLENKVKSLSLENFVHFAGMLPRDQIPKHMFEHDIFLLSSNYETFGVVVAEALAAGLFCISTDCGGPADIINDRNGRIVPIGDPTAMAQAMISISKTKYKTDAVNRRQISMTQFSEEIVCKSLINRYERILAGKHTYVV